MAETLDRKLVVAVSSSALFDLAEADEVFRCRGVEGYRAYQRAHEDMPLGSGSVFPLVRRLLDLNSHFAPAEAPVEVVLLSRNDPDTGLRVLRSIAAHGLPMSRAIFLSGRNPFRHARALDASLFLSTHDQDVRAALKAGVPAGRICPGGTVDTDVDHEIRIAFDFDGVLADDASERLYQAEGLDAFHRSEHARAEIPLGAGPLARFGRRVAALQARLAGCRRDGNGMAPVVRTAIVTSRGAPAHTRVVRTLRAWGIAVDEAFFLGGLPKAPVLAELRPHIFFDDQVQHIEAAGAVVPCAHVPFGAINRREAVGRSAASATGPSSDRGQVPRSPAMPAVA